MKGPTLAAKLDQFSKIEKLICCHAMNLFGNQSLKVHPGLLPFLSVNDVLVALESYQHASDFSPIAQVKNKLKRLYDLDNVVKFTMTLHPAKVVKQFGPNLVRGFRIPYVTSQRVTVGVKWSLPKRDYVPDDDVLVSPYFTIIKGPDKKWIINCQQHHVATVHDYLAAKCT